MSEVPKDSGNQAPQPLTPEQIKTREAAFVYLTRIAQGMEGFLDGPDYYSKAPVWHSKRKPSTASIDMTGIMDERVLTVHTPPDKYTEHSTELTFKTKVIPLRTGDETIQEGAERWVYEPSSENVTLYAQHGPRGFGSPEVPMEQAELALLDSVLEEMFAYVPEVVGGARSQVATIMQGPDA